MLFNVAIVCSLITLLLSFLMQLMGKINQLRVRLRIMRFKQITGSGALRVRGILHRTWKGKTIVLPIDSFYDLLNGTS